MKGSARSTYSILQTIALSAVNSIGFSTQQFSHKIENTPSPALDVIIMDNLAAHKSKAAENAIKARGAWILFLPPYSPDLDPIEMAFAKLKAHLRAKAVRTIDALWQETRHICNLFEPAECQNYFTAAGYEFS